MAQFESIRFQPSRPLLKELSADRLNTILAEIRRNRPRGERGITVRQSGDATYIGLASTSKSGAAGSAAIRQPWDIYVHESESSESGDTTYTLKVRPGTLARILPSNWNDEFPGIDDDSLYYGIARVTTDGTYIVGVTLTISNEPPVPQLAQKFGLSEEIDVLFGLFKGGGSYNLINQGNIEVTGTNVIATQPDPPADPGGPMFDLWFRLQ